MAYIRELNLLPPARRRYLAQQLMLNAAVRFLHSVNLSLGIVTAAGLTAIVILQILVTLLSSATTTILADEVKNYQELRTKIAKQNENLSAMAKLSKDQTVWSEIFADLFSTMPPGTKMSSISGEANVITKISFSGQAFSRSALVVLQDRLQNLPWVKEVQAPNSNLLERVNPTYTFDVILKTATTPTPAANAPK